MKRTLAHRSLWLAPLLLSACLSITDPDERIVTLEVAESRVACIGSVPQECLRVRKSSDQPYTWFYSWIEGFDYEPGYRYVIDVAERTIANPPADGSSLAYRLVAIRSKNRVAPTP